MSSSSASKIDRQAIGNSQHGSRFTDSKQIESRSGSASSSSKQSKFTKELIEASTSGSSKALVTPANKDPPPSPMDTDASIRDIENQEVPDLEDEEASSS